jgi:hypothetical protein
MFHFVPNMHRFREGRMEWDDGQWNAWVDAVNVEQAAAQANDIGAGYVILSISQGGGYSCAPNPVIRKYWNLQEGESASRRDLPMELYHALKAYEIPLMLYVAAEVHLLPGEASEKAGWFGKNYQFDRCTSEGEDHWVEALQWYSDHYGDKISGWWVDGVDKWTPEYSEKIHDALSHGNPGTLTTSGNHARSDFHHGHCLFDWEAQQKILPTAGRWDEDHNIQWHAFQHLGWHWAARGTPHSTESIVEYASTIVNAGGVITLDVGTFDEEPEIVGPYLKIPDDQMAQLRAVQGAINQIKHLTGLGPGRLLRLEG